jgi:hypothetical protein
MFEPGSNLLLVRDLSPPRMREGRELQLLHMSLAVASKIMRRIYTYVYLHPNRMNRQRKPKSRPEVDIQRCSRLLVPATEVRLGGHVTICCAVVPLPPAKGIRHCG